MLLRHIERGTVMYILEEPDGNANSEIIEADFRYLEDDKLFVIRCKNLNADLAKLQQDARLKITFMAGANTNTFTGCVREKQRNGTVLIEQLSDIVSHNRRKTSRDEIRVAVKVFALTDSQLKGPFHVRLAGEPVLSDVTFDISVGGLCIITNNHLVSDTDPLYLAEFSLGERDYHLLPVRLVRRASCKKTVIGRYDYGFEFIMDDLPEESGRLTKGILNRKLLGHRA